MADREEETECDRPMPGAGEDTVQQEFEKFTKISGLLNAIESESSSSNGEQKRGKGQQTVGKKRSYSEVKTYEKKIATKIRRSDPHSSFQQSRDSADISSSDEELKNIFQFLEDINLDDEEPSSTSQSRKRIMNLEAAKFIPISPERLTKKRRLETIESDDSDS